MKLNRLLATASVASLLCMGAGQLVAQDNPPPGAPDQGRQGRGPGGRGGNFDPAQMEQRLKERLEVTDDAEWKAIQPLVQKVMEARMQAFSGRGGRGGRGGGPGGPGGFGQPSPEAEALQKAIDGKASSAEMKAALAKYVASRKAKQAELESAQAELRKVLTPRQEAIATLNGLL